MIVVDTNTIAYLYLPTQYTEDVERLFDHDTHWVAPYLWRSEFRNILTLYLRKQLLSLETAYAMQAQAEVLINGHEYSVDSNAVLKLAVEAECSAYDCEFIYLAQSLGTKLVTGDKKLQNAFPGVAVSAKAFLQ